MCICAFSAGIGRSGSFVAILWLMQICARGILPDVHLAVRDLRRHRVLMVQNVVRVLTLKLFNKSTHIHTRDLTSTTCWCILHVSMGLLEILCGKVMCVGAFLFLGAIHTCASVSTSLARKHRQTQVRILWVHTDMHPNTLNSVHSTCNICETSHS